MCNEEIFAVLYIRFYFEICACASVTSAVVVAVAVCHTACGLIISSSNPSNVLIFILRKIVIRWIRIKYKVDCTDIYAQCILNEVALYHTLVDLKRYTNLIVHTHTQSIYGRCAQAHIHTHTQVFIESMTDLHFMQQIHMHACRAHNILLTANI